MDKVGSPRGLGALLDAGGNRRASAPGASAQDLVYACGLSLLVSGFAYAVTHRAPFDLDVLRDRNTLYRELDDGRIENVFSVRIINKDQRGQCFACAA